MSIKEMGPGIPPVDPKEVMPQKPEEEIEGGLENKEGEGAEESVEETSKIDSLEKKKKGLIERIKETRKQKREVKEGEKILSKEEKEKREQERKEARNEINDLFLEMSGRIKNGEETISQRQELFKLGNNPELAEYAKKKLINLKETVNDVFPKKIKALKEDLKNYTSVEYHPDDFDKGKEIFDKKDRHIKELEETYEHTLRKFKRDIRDLSSIEKGEK